MKPIIAVLCAVAFSAFGQTVSSPLIPGRSYVSLVLADRTHFSDIRVLSLSEAELVISHKEGVATIPLHRLTPYDLARTGIPPEAVLIGGISGAMSPAERDRTGIDKLSVAEQQELQDWIIRMAEHHQRTAPRPEVRPLPRKKPLVMADPAVPEFSVRRAGRVWSEGVRLPSRGHYILGKVRSSQPKIQLEDRSLWDVSPAESYTMFLWQPADEIALLEGDDPEYPIAMVNTSQGRSVNVRYFGP